MIEELLRIDAALTGLPAKVREVFLQSQVDGLTYSQIANAKSQVSDLLKQNAAGAQTLINDQLAQLREIDQRSPAPAERSLLNAQ